MFTPSKMIRDLACKLFMLSLKICSHFYYTTQKKYVKQITQHIYTT